MKAWAKRMIWFFLYDLHLAISELEYYHIHGVSLDYTGTQGFLILMIMLIPLILMKDDKEVKK